MHEIEIKDPFIFDKLFINIYRYSFCPLLPRPKLESDTYNRYLQLAAVMKFGSALRVLLELFQNFPSRNPHTRRL